ncbi:protein NO VEIN domain-containing protein [Halobacillus yeomjeoni]|uniref:protein NO VEIN domain-containing protein n=1 Tax=Halobacillus yeomjeoni TaxID=311194 RepID=UPI00399D5E14
MLEEVTEKNIEWFNKGFENNENHTDLSLGYDIGINLGHRFIKLEVKSSFQDAGYYKITRNELMEMASTGKEYFVLKVNSLKELSGSGKINITVEKSPLWRYLEDLSRIKSMEVYG